MKNYLAGVNASKITTNTGITKLLSSTILCKILTNYNVN